MLKVGARFSARLRVALRFVHHRSARLEATGKHLRAELDKLGQEHQRSLLTQAATMQDKPLDHADGQHDDVRQLAPYDGSPVPTMLDDLLADEEIRSTGQRSPTARLRPGNVREERDRTCQSADFGKALRGTSRLRTCTPTSTNRAESAGVMRSSKDVLRPRSKPGTAKRPAETGFAALHVSAALSTVAQATQNARRGGLGNQPPILDTATTPPAKQPAASSRQRQRRPATGVNGRPIIRSPRAQRHQPGAPHSDRFQGSMTNADVILHKQSARYFS